MKLPHVVLPVPRGPKRPRKQEPLGAPMPQKRMLAVLKCHAPDGANVANLVLNSDGTVVSHGDFSLALNALRQLAEANLATSLRAHYRAHAA